MIRAKANTLKIALIVCGLVLAVVGSLPLADIIIDEGRGPVTVYVPSSYDPEVPSPLICLLHGYGGSGLTCPQFCDHTQS